MPPAFFLGSCGMARSYMVKFPEISAPILGKNRLPCLLHDHQMKKSPPVTAGDSLCFYKKVIQKKTF
ncbi:hypothetical protein FTV88_3219 [Heliorestis convoluta]|uniref:Uncharacterized protein n=1 Tax=Heliorestis convoluta TaxID=356322 RepID=A0A5Q2N9X5_9FIRM|nr:hypothetical protein FTV88_3219 [Heliorestis convoluta]